MEDKRDQVWPSRQLEQLYYGVVGVDLAKLKGCRFQVNEAGLVNFCCQPSKHCAIIILYRVAKTVSFRRLKHWACAGTLQDFLHTLQDGVARGIVS